MAANPTPWVVYYADDISHEALFPYNIIILEGEHNPKINALLENNKIVLGYLNLGEVEDFRPYFNEIKDKGLLLEQNPNWPDSYYVDLRNKLWTKKVINTLIPNILFQHFTGIFIDTIDNPIYLEEKDPQKYKGMKQAAIDLIKTIRLHYPTIKIMVNRGFEILQDIVNDVDFVLAECILTTCKKDTKHAFVHDKEYQESVKLLKNAQKKNPKLEVLTLDYFQPDDKEAIKTIYQIQRKNGFSPYVATYGLDEIIPEPK